MSRCVIAQPGLREDPSVIHEIYVARKQPKTLTAFGKQLSIVCVLPVALAYVASNAICIAHVA